MIEHVSVLLDEVVDGLRIQPKGKYVDATFGAGGHSKAIIEKLDSEGRLMGFDQDDEVWPNVFQDDRLVFAPANFRFLEHYLDYHGWSHVDGIMADLGVSSHHLDTERRGFSYRFDGQLDMRMNVRSALTGKDVVMSYSEKDLVRIFSDYGEVRNAKTLARHMVEYRKSGKVDSTADLVHCISPMIRGQRERYLAQVFQSIRIEVNDELGVLSEFLDAATKRLKSGGVLAVISFHSLEDRLVKRWMKSGSVDGRVKTDEFGRGLVPFLKGSGKLITATSEELKRNPRSNSAKLRIAIKK